ncbi:MAG: DUF3095 family protein [Akkermansiaceae bacterium]|nr:DUF3095 family protein [Akkermansiaceae bacterium]
MNFYQQLQSFRDFHEITEDRHYVEVPDEWWVVVVDIVDSTRAIENGRYRDVNTLGAAAIVAVQNALGEGRFPFVFGGDGATLLIDPADMEPVRKQLCGLRRMAREAFQLTMRVGALPVSGLKESHIEVAKMELAGERALAVFRGGGVSEADERIKREGGAHDLEEIAGSRADLSGLSCRWQPIAPKRDLSLSLLVRARGDKTVYQQVLRELGRIYGDSIDVANPVNTEAARYRTIRSCLADERRYHHSLWSPSFAWRAFEIVCAVLIFGHGMPGPFSARKYVKSLSRHNDHRKFDDMLRMVLDCSKQQRAEIKAMLESKRHEGLLDYGMHSAGETLMTCFFHGAGEGQHIHFIDGGDGGYAMAAKQLKAQLAGC